MIWRLVGRVKEKEIALVLAPGEYSVGAGSEVDLRLQDETVSRRHALLRVDHRGVEIEDLDSKNGTWINTEKVKRRLLPSGCELRLGRIALELQHLDDGDGEVGLRFGSAMPSLTSVDSWNEETVRSSPLDEWLEDHLPQLLAAAHEGDSLRIATEGGASLASLGIIESLTIVRVGRGLSATSDGAAVLYASHQPSEGEAAGDSDSDLVLEARQGMFLLSARYSNRAAAARVEAAARCLLAAVEVASNARTFVEPTTPLCELPAPRTTDPGLLSIYLRAQQAAQSEMPTVITGETGTGKELLARFFHAASARSGEPFIAINCAALPRDLLEAELFGIERGVATGVEARAGRFEQANGGTLFLDEIGDMPLETQAMILRVLQEGEVHRIGSDKARSADVVVVSATHSDLRAAIAEGTFREDLFYRLASWIAEVPPLRARNSDLAALAGWFAGREADRRGKRIDGISRAALAKLAAFDWPGNVRQLEQEMRRAVAFCPAGGLIDMRTLSAEVLAGPNGNTGANLAERLERFERLEIEKAIGLTGGNVPATAEALGLTRSTMYRRVKALGIEI